MMIQRTTDIAAPRRSQDGAEIDLPSEEVRTAAYNDELVRRYRLGHYLTETDKREARALIARKLA